MCRGFTFIYRYEKENRPDLPIIIIVTIKIVTIFTEKHVMIADNPFVIHGFASGDLFCGREKETEMLVCEISNGNNVSLSSRRQLGKKALVLNVFFPRSG